MSMLEIATMMRGNHWSPIAVSPTSKRPLVRGWDRFSHELPTEEDILTQFNADNVGVGLVCGECSDVFVIDLDGEEGIENFKNLCPNKRPPSTVISRTGGGGIHMFFTLPHSDDIGFEISNSVGKIADKIDVRSNGGFVVLPPSPHPSGNKYEWIRKPWWWEEEFDYCELEEVASPPMWLIDILREAYTTSDVKNYTHPDEAIPDGQRNNTLASMAGAMRWAGMTENGIIAGLMAENNRCNPPLPESEIKAIARSVSRYQPSEVRKRGGFKRRGI